MKKVLTLMKMIFNKALSPFKILFIAMLAISPTAYAITSSKISTESKNIVQQNPPLTVLNNSEVEPNSKSVVIALPQITLIRGGFSNKSESARSFFINFWTYWAQYYGYQVTFVTLDQHDSKIALENGEIDIIASGAYDDKNVDKFYTSIPYIEVQGVLFQNKTFSLHEDSDKKLTIATHSPFTSTENFIEDEDVETVHYTYMESLLGQLYDYDLIYSFMPHQDEDILVHNLKQYKSNNSITTPLMLRAITTHQNRQLMFDINEGIRNINRNSAEASLNVSSLEKKGGFKVLLGNYLTHLSLQQQAFVIDNPIIRYGVAEGGYPPYHYIEFGQLYGLNADLFKELTERLGLTFKGIKFNSFERSLHALKRETISLMPLVYDTPVRQDWFLFTDPIDKYSASIISNNNNKHTKLEDLKDAKIAVISGAQVTNIIQSKIPGARLLFMMNETEALIALANGKVDAYVGNISNAVYLINKLQLENLYLHNSNDFDSEMQYSMAISQSQPELQALLNLGLQSIDHNTLSTYRAKWMKTILIQGDDKRYDELYFALIILIITSVIIFLGYFIFSQYQKKNHLKAKNKIETALHEAQHSRQEAEKSALAKTEFLARMSHEIRTPMNGVLGMAEAISFTELNAEQKDLLNTLHKSALNLMGLLNDVLDFSKMDAGKMILDSRVFSLKSMLNHTIDNFRHQASSKGIVISTNIDTALDTHYIGDDMRLMQVFNNLLSNALKFTPKGGITVNITKEEQATSSKNKKLSADFEEVTVEIQDTGIGISAEKINTLFTPFVQAENHTTRRFGGSGLGLSICKEIIVAMGGDIKVTSMPKLGSIFTFSFILKVCEQPEVDNSSSCLNKDITVKNSNSNSNKLESYKVLLAEDNAVNRKVLCGQLTRLGFNVDSAENGLIAYQMFQEKSYDIIFSDCHMPEMDGFTLANKISHERVDKIPQLIAITADALTEASQRCLDAGFDHYLSKPCPIEILQNKLLEVQETLLTIKLENKDSIKVTNNTHFNKEYTLMMSGDDIELVNDMILVYLETAPDDIKKIILASDQLMFAETKDLAHKIKGSIQYFGATELAMIAKDIELYAENKDAHNMQLKTELFSIGLHELHQEIQNWQQQL